MSVLRAILFSAGFAVFALLGVGMWATWKRSSLGNPMGEDGIADARAVLAFAAEREPADLRSDLMVRARLEELVKERGMMGVVIVDPAGKVLARAGELEPPIVDAALEDVSAKPGAREVGQRMLYREVEGDLIAIVIEDRAPVDAAWRPIRNRALLLAIVAILLSPLFGILLARKLRRS